MSNSQPRLVELVKKTIVVHTVTYFVVGVAAYLAFDYATKFSDPKYAGFIRKMDHPLIAAGPLFQPIRGLLFALAFYPLREVLFGRKNGWLILWWMLLVVGIFSTFGPAPCSIEGMIYTVFPFVDHITGLPETVFQTMALSYLLCVWVGHSEKRWLSGILYGGFVAVLILATLGLLSRLGG